MSMDIDELRQEIDNINDKLLGLFERRMEISKEIGRYKKERLLPVKDEERERQVLRRMCEKAQPELAEYVKALFLSLFEMSSNYQIAQNKCDSAGNG